MEGLGNERGVQQVGLLSRETKCAGLVVLAGLCRAHKPRQVYAEREGADDDKTDEGDPQTDISPRR